MTLIAALLAVAATPAGLTLEINSPQTTVLVGEPVKLVVTWRATTTLEERIYPEDDEFTDGSLIFLVYDGQVEYPYRECARALYEQISAPFRLKRGEEIVRSFVLIRGTCVSGDGARGGLLFATRGEYLVRAVYEKYHHRVESNAVAFTVSEPAGEEREVFAAALPDLTVLHAGKDRETQATSKALIARYRSSRYLRWARLQWLEHKAAVIPGSLPHSEPPPIKAYGRKYRDVAAEILEQGNWGPFEEEALILANRLASGGEDDGLLQKIRGLLFKKYAESPAVKKIKADLAASEARMARPVP